MTVRDYLEAAGIVLAGFSSLFLLFCCFSALLAAILFRFAVHRRRRRKTGTHSAGLEPFDPMIREGVTWADGQSFETVHIRSRDGLTLAGRFLPGDDPKQRRPDITLARDRLGWEPAVTLREGLTKTIAYFEAQLAHQKNDPAPKR